MDLSQTVSSPKLKLNAHLPARIPNSHSRSWDFIVFYFQFSICQMKVDKVSGSENKINNPLLTLGWVSV